MKIAFLSPFNPYRGGIAQFSDLLYQELISEGHSVKAYNFKRQYPSMLFPGKTQLVLEKDINNNIESEMILDSVVPSSWQKTGSVISSGGYDMMLVSYWMPFFAISTGRPARAYRKKGGKVIAIMHNVIPHEKRPGDKKLTKYFLNSCDGFIVMNDDSAEDILKIKTDAKIKTMFHPVYSQYPGKKDRNEAREKLGIPKDKKVILFFGFIRDYKGYDLLLESLVMLNDSYLVLTAGEVYGSFEKYVTIIEKFNLSKKLMLKLDYISDEMVSEYFSAADVCILPYRSATQSGITAASYHFEKPLIVTDMGGLGESIRRDNTGLVCPSATPASIAETIKKFFSENRTEEYIKNIRIARDKYSWKNYVSGVIELYNQIR